MYFTRKLKPPIINTEGILGIIGFVTFFFLIILSYRLAMGFGALITIIAALFSLVIMIRTRNMYYLASVIGQLLATAFLCTIAFYDIVEGRPFVIALAGLMIAVMTLMIIFILQKKMKWRTREVLEMAALPVEDVNNGFTSRPLQAGHLNYSAAELHEFSSFIRKNLIAIPVHEEEKIVFVVNIPLGRLLVFSGRYKDCSWISFDYEGNVTASISQRDYFLYKDQLAFDQLCDSLGKLFIGFYEDHRSGADQKIIDQFNAMKLNIITEG